ncbi:MAG: competence/damage-inducible protein cinA [Cyanobacteria bacterium RYN_339]|nr:competence/damage-inducible protein cinA [Cyanobacteria bacterium RYN_339]
MRAEVLCIGTELLIGQVVNTNATYLAKELAAIGVDLLWVTTVGDNPARMDAAIATALDRADLVLVTGGLGPTADDLTVEAVARVLGEPMAERPEVRAHIEGWFRERNRPLAPSNYKQTLFPTSAELIPNPTGTAYGLRVRKGHSQLMAFPGVPMELRAMWTSWARPQIERESGSTLRSVLLRYVGIGEALLAERVAHLLEGSNPTVAPYAGDWEVHLRVSAKAATAAEADALMAPVLAELRAIQPYYYGSDDVTLAAAVGQLLRARGETVATAESCTSGLLASRFTDVPKSSDYMRGGVVAYATDVKQDLLGLSEDVLAHGVVSEPVASALAQAARRVLKSDWGVGITGWAGSAPTPEDSGLVWIAVAGPAGAAAVAELQRFGGAIPRETVKYRATQTALALLRRQLMT